jgi:gliding motility-associated-like protein
VALTAFNQVGCSDTAWIRINVTEDLIFYVPNTFTPNDDEKNQEFKPILSQGFKPGTYLLRIFNRWGELIFESKDQEVGWDGSYGPNSINSEIGTYTWVLTFQVLQTQGDKEIVGHVNLIR